MSLFLPPFYLKLWKVLSSETEGNLFSRIFDFCFNIFTRGPVEACCSASRWIASQDDQKPNVEISSWYGARRYSHWSWRGRRKFVWNWFSIKFDKLILYCLYILKTTSKSDCYLTSIKSSKYYVCFISLITVWTDFLYRKNLQVI